MTAVWQANSFKLFFNLLTKNGWALETQKGGFLGGASPPQLNGGMRGAWPPRLQTKVRAIEPGATVNTGGQQQKSDSGRGMRSMISARLLL